MAEMEDYQRQRVAVLCQLLDIYGIPKEVFVSHCKGMGILGINFRGSVKDPSWNAANMQDIVDWMSRADAVSWGIYSVTYYIRIVSTHIRCA